MKRLFSALFFALVLLGGCGQKEPGQPNIIVIIADDHRHDFLGSVQPQFVQTPNLDRLAAEGIRFSNAFVTTSLCSPARATYLTGVYAHTHQVVVNEDMDIPADLPNVAQRLQTAGYETAYIGKWHMARRSSPRPGFDHWVSFHGQGHYFTNTLNVNDDWELSTNYITDELTDRAIEYLNRDHGRPYLMFLSHKAIHEPFNPADRDSNRLQGEPLPRYSQPNDSISEKSPWKENRRPGSGDLLVQKYRQTLLSVDENLGRLVDTLEANGQLENTVIIYAGDNGYLMGEHDGLWDKRAPFEPSIRVPLIMSWPAGVAKGQIKDDLILNLDLAPTLMELAGMPAAPEIQGRSWLGEGAGRESFLYEYFAYEGKVPTCLAVRGKRYKFVAFPRNPELQPELFDLQEDPHETVNLIDRPEHAGLLRELRDDLDRHMKETDFQWPEY